MALCILWWFEVPLKQFSVVLTVLDISLVEGVHQYTGYHVRSEDPSVAIIVRVRVTSVLIVLATVHHDDTPTILLTSIRLACLL